MDETSHDGASRLTDRSLAVAIITLTRFLADEKPGLADYLQTSLEHARASHLQDADLAVLRLMIGAIRKA